MRAVEWVVWMGESCAFVASVSKTRTTDFQENILNKIWTMSEEANAVDMVIEIEELGSEMETWAS